MMTPQPTIRIRLLKDYTPYADATLPVLTEGESLALAEWLGRALIDLGYAVFEEPKVRGSLGSSR